MDDTSAQHAIVRPVPDSYDQCIQTKSEKIDVDIAKKQHREYCRALQKLGLELVWIPKDNNLPDSCFVEDTAMIFGETAVVCNMKMKSRADETVEVAKALEELMETYHIKPPATIDGGDVIQIKDKVFVGLSNRTNEQATVQLRGILESTGRKVIPVKVRNVLHLKSACTYLGDNYVIFSDGCFNTDILHGFDRIAVPADERYATDCLAINGTVLVAKGYPKTKNLIEERGFPVEELDTSEFRKGDGALTCLSIVW